MSAFISEEDLQNLQFGDIVYTGHSSSEDFIYANQPEEVSYYLKWFVHVFPS